jgi:signal transduction histidine kinase
MAQDRLTTALARRARSVGRLPPWVTGAAALVLVVGAGVDVVSGPTGRAALDWIVGAGFTVAVIRGRPDGPPRGPSVHVWLGLATAGLWFASSGAGLLPPAWHSVGAALTVVAYRGTLLHWLVKHAGGRSRGPVIAALAVGYTSAFTGTRASAVGTAAAAVVLAVAVTASERSRQDDARRIARTTAWVMAALGVTWAGFAADLVPAPSRQVLDAVVLLGAAVALGRPAAAGGLSGAVGNLVVELGPLSRQRAPLSASLARALADPQLLVRAYNPGKGWTDELGRPVADPVVEADEGVTLAADPDGGRVALVHSEAGAANGPLAQAAAQAALLALESVRLEADVRREAAAVRESTARLVIVDEEERRALAGRLQSGPLSRLERLREALAHRRDELSALTEELDHVMADLGDLAAGLDPAGIRAQGLSRTLARLCQSMGFPVEHQVSRGTDDLSADIAALTYFVAAEALTNVAHHAAATRAWVELEIHPRAMRLTIGDDGRGNLAVHKGRGVQGLVDRVEFVGGRLTIDSPPGGPTRLVAELPLNARHQLTEARSQDPV